MAGLIAETPAARPVVLQVKRGAFEEHEHPRDRNGRFIKKGGAVQLPNGDVARVLDIDSEGLYVAREDGTTEVVAPGDVANVADDAPSTPAVPDAAPSLAREDTGGNPPPAAPSAPSGDETDSPDPSPFTAAIGAVYGDGDGSPIPHPATAEEAVAFFRDGLPDFGGWKQDHNSYDPDETAEQRDRRYEASKQAKTEVVDDLVERLGDLPDGTLMGDGSLAGGVLAQAEAVRGTPDRVLARRRLRLDRDATDPVGDYEYRAVPRANWDSLPEERRAALGLEEVTDEALEEVRQHGRRAAVSNLLNIWAQSTNDLSAGVLAMQQIAADEFSLSSYADWPPLTDGGYPQLVADVATMRERRGEVMAAFLHAQYEATQARFKAAGITHVTVYRGYKHKPDIAEAPPWTEGVEPGSPQTVDSLALRPMSSWSIDPGLAHQFAGDSDGRNDVGYLLTASVPVAQVLSTARTGNGVLTEGEIVLLHGPGEWTVQHADDPIPEADAA